ncbi:MAG: hypothetical protein ABH830_01615 [Patescibacteria group bacterium]
MIEKYTPEIIADNPEQHKEGIVRQLRQLQVLFCDRLYQQYKDECKKNDKPIDKALSDILEEQEAYYSGDLRMLEIIYSERSLSEEELFSLITEKYYKNINKLYDELPEGKVDDNSPEYIKSRINELNKLVDYLEVEQKKAKDKFPDKWREMTERPKNENGYTEGMAGIIAFNTLKEGYSPDVRQIETALREEGFSEFDDFLEIHLPSQYGKQKINPKIITESLTCLAEKIIDKYPETRAIVAVSWLLSHRVIQRFIKMKVIGEKGNNWSQLIGNNGQIDQARVEKFFSTGKMPYGNLIGYINVEEFLQKYLPDNRRGKIKLKKIKENFDPEKLQIENTFQEEKINLDRTWDSKKLDSKEKVVNFLESLRIFKEVLQHLGYYEKFEEMMVGNIGRLREDINSENRAMLNKLEADFKKYLDEINQEKYIDEEIVID